MGNQDLHLQGAGLRTKLIFDVYVAALYVGDRPVSAAALMETTNPRVITLRLMRDVDALTLGHALDEGLQANLSPAELESLRPAVERLLAIMADIKLAVKGSQVVLSLGSEGVSVAFDGVERGRVIHPLVARAPAQGMAGRSPGARKPEKGLAWRALR